MYMGDFPSGQRGQTVNLLAMPSVVRIHHPPPKSRLRKRSAFLFWGTGFEQSGGPWAAKNMPGVMFFSSRLAESTIPHQKADCASDRPFCLSGDQPQGGGCPWAGEIQATFSFFLRRSIACISSFTHLSPRGAAPEGPSGPDAYALGIFMVSMLLFRSFSKISLLITNFLVRTLQYHKKLVMSIPK